MATINGRRLAFRGPVSSLIEIINRSYLAAVTFSAEHKEPWPGVQK